MTDLQLFAALVALAVFGVVSLICGAVLVVLSLVRRSRIRDAERRGAELAREHAIGWDRGLSWAENMALQEARRRRRFRAACQEHGDHVA